VAAGGNAGEGLRLSPLVPRHRQRAASIHLSLHEKKYQVALLEFKPYPGPKQPVGVDERPAVGRARWQGTAVLLERLWAWALEDHPLVGECDQAVAVQVPCQRPRLGMRQHAEVAVDRARAQEPGQRCGVTAFAAPLQ
jgi:hypothetical protein